MLLSSQAFSSFLQELSQSGLPTNIQQQVQQAPQQRERAQSTRKEVNPHEAARQLQSQPPAQVGMVLMPETNVDMSLFDVPAWRSAAPNDFQVFAVTELPEGPVLDLPKCSEKPTKPATESTMPTVSSKLQPLLSEAPSTPSLSPISSIHDSCSGVVGSKTTTTPIHMAEASTISGKSAGYLTVCESSDPSDIPISSCGLYLDLMGSSKRLDALLPWN